MPAKNFIKYHNDGSIWAKGKMIDGVPTGYWEWFRKEDPILRSGYFKEVNKPQSGPLMIKKERFIK